MDKSGFTAYLKGKDLSAVTIAARIKSVEDFFGYIQKDEIEVAKPDVLNYLEHLKSSRAQQNATRSKNLAAINHYFTFLYQSGQICANPCIFLKIRGIRRGTVYQIYTPEELDALFDNYYALFVRAYDDSHIPHSQRKRAALNRERNAAILSILVHQGVFTTEIGKIETDDLDFRKAAIRIRGSGKKLNERVVPLKAAQMGILMDYVRSTRPMILQYHAAESGKLFLPLPAVGKRKTGSGAMCDVCIMLTPALKSIDPQFLNYKQVRASVIAHWIKAHGLRKAQYWAGHRTIVSTEEFATHILDDLTGDINKLHPF